MSPDAPDSTATSSTATEVATEVTPEEPIVPEEIKDEKQRNRVQKLVTELKTTIEELGRYKAHGSIEEIAGLKTQLQTYEGRLNAQIERLESAREPGEAKSDDQKKLESARAEAKVEIRNIDGGIARGERAANILDEMTEGLDEEALEAQVNLMKEFGMSTKPEDVERVAKLVSAEIKGNPKLKRLYFRDPEAAVKRGLTSVQELFTSAATRKTNAQIQTDKEKLAHLPKSHGGGGAAVATQTPAAPQTAAEGVKRAMARLREQ